MAVDPLIRLACFSSMHCCLTIFRSLFVLRLLFHQSIFVVVFSVNIFVLLFFVSCIYSARNFSSRYFSSFFCSYIPLGEYPQVRLASAQLRARGSVKGGFSRKGAKLSGRAEISK